MIGNAISNMMIKPGLSPVFEGPADHGLDYEDVTFETVDGATLRGWLIKGGQDKVVIQTHFGVQCSRAGYTPQGKGMIKLWPRDISFLRQARALVDRGYSVLMYDMRNHGESEAGDCPWVSWGPKEAQDVIAAVKYVSERDDYASASIGLLSICMGAAATTYAYGTGAQELVGNPRIKALVAVQPLHYKEFVKAFGIPGFLSKSGTRRSEERLGFNLEERTFLPDAGAIDVPTLVIQNRNDPWTNIDFVQRYYDGLTVEKEMSWLELSKDRAAAYDWLGTEPGAMIDFFDGYM